MRLKKHDYTVFEHEFFKCSYHVIMSKNWTYLNIGGIFSQKK